MENIQNLSELLMTEGLIERLAETQSIEEYKAVMKEFNV
jgi:PTS system ascorbate-specific IIA component